MNWWTVLIFVTVWLSFAYLIACIDDWFINRRRH